MAIRTSGEQKQYSTDTTIPYRKITMYIQAFFFWLMIKYLTALWNAIGDKIGGFPKPLILVVIEKDEIAETQKTKQNTHRFHGFPVKYKREVTTRLLA